MSFSRCSSLDIRLFTSVFSCSLSRSAYFGVLSNFLARFSRLALRLLLLFFCVCFFFDRSVSFYTTYFHSKLSLHELELRQFPPADKTLALWVLLLCLTVYLRCAALKLDTRVCVLHCHLLVSPGAH